MYINVFSGAAKFAEGLAGNTILKRLDLSLNNLKDDGTLHIAAGERLLCCIVLQCIIERCKVLKSVAECCRVL